MFEISWITLVAGDLLAYRVLALQAMDRDIVNVTTARGLLSVLHRRPGVVFSSNTR